MSERPRVFYLITSEAAISQALLVRARLTALAEIVERAPAKAYLDQPPVVNCSHAPTQRDFRDSPIYQRRLRSQRRRG